MNREITQHQFVACLLRGKGLEFASIGPQQSFETRRVVKVAANQPDYEEGEDEDMD